MKTCIFLQALLFYECERKSPRRGNGSRHTHASVIFVNRLHLSGDRYAFVTLRQRNRNGKLDTDVKLFLNDTMQVVPHFSDDFDGEAIIVNFFPNRMKFFLRLTKSAIR